MTSNRLSHRRRNSRRPPSCKKPPPPTPPPPPIVPPPWIDATITHTGGTPSQTITYTLRCYQTTKPWLYWNHVNLPLGIIATCIITYLSATRKINATSNTNLLGYAGTATWTTSAQPWTETRDATYFQLGATAAHFVLSSP